METARHLMLTSKDCRTAYYQAGFAVEQILVALGLKQRMLKDVPKSEIGGTWHNLAHLMERHGLIDSMKMEMKTNKPLRDSWLVVKDWETNGRFPTASLDRKSAQNMLNSSAKVFEWLLNRYEKI